MCTYTNSLLSTKSLLVFFSSPSHLTILSLFEFLPSYTLMFFSISLFVSWVLLCRKNSKLHISRVRLEDSGNYTCVAENSLGRENATGYISVQSSKSCIISLFANGWESQETTCSSWGIFFCVYFIFTADMLYKISVLWKHTGPVFSSGQINLLNCWSFWRNTWVVFYSELFPLKKWNLMIFI